MEKRNIVIIGGDKRQKYLKAYLISEGYNAESYGLFDWDDDSDRLKSIIKPQSAVILPLPAARNGKTINMPFSKKELPIDRVMEFLGSENLVFGGIIKDTLLQRLKEDDIAFVDYYDEEFISQNAILTAFGTLKIILEHIDFSLPLGKYAVTGYGRVAREVSSLLSSLSCSVTVFARRQSQLREASIRGCRALDIGELDRFASEFDIIINTVPSEVIGGKALAEIRKDSKIIELASAPYGVNFDTAGKHGVDVIRASGLPGKYTPKTAGEIIGKRIEECLEREVKE